MFIAKIIGTVVSTIKINKIEKVKLLIADVIDPYGKKEGLQFLVADAIGVGEGEKVLISDDDQIVSQILGKEKVPIRSAVVAKIDKINILF